jgi:NAD(P)-dependent dehydrogenase (short-subunit alcohol dehydrogenase family)
VADNTFNPFVLVTGASTGIGRSCAIRLARSGYRVIATVRNEQDFRSIGSAVHESAHRIRAVMLDVAEPASIAAATAFIEHILDGEGLYALINNAGICVVGPCESVGLADWKRQFDVNLFGMIAVTQAMLPFLRTFTSQNASTSARIVNISSVTASVPTPVFGAYCASKAAVDSFSSTLRRELYDQDVRVSTIIPGTIQSEIWRKEKSGVAALAGRPDCRRLYGRLIDSVSRYVFRAAEKAKPADEVAIAVERCLTRKVPPIYTLVAWEAYAGVFANRFLPARLLDFLIRKSFGLGKPPPLEQVEEIDTEDQSLGASH